MDRGRDLAADLLDCLRARLDDRGLELSEPLTPVSGGFDTRIFAFRLRGAAPPFAGPLILRLLGPQHDPTRVLRERVTQNTLAGLGYPAPRVLLASPDRAPLGGAWLIMERLPGKPLLQARYLNLSRILADTQLRLHALDAEALLRAMDEEGRDSRAAGGPVISREMITLEGHVAQLEARIARGSLDGLRPAMAWLVERRPGEQSRRVICHGDFHPHNILYSGSSVTGVIDWPNAVVAEPAYDVATTRIILRYTPIELSTLPGPLRWLVATARLVMVKRYLAGYRRRRSIDPRSLAYYEALSAMRALIRAAESRRGQGAAASNPLDASRFAETLAAHFSAISGVTPILPPRRP
jgi:aminoglycoside phosphotransferase (APT) family kinase protein